jgi:hypothetical protein
VAIGLGEAWKSETFGMWCMAAGGVVLGNSGRDAARSRLLVDWPGRSPKI